jgi:hypothetical protein
MYTDIFEVKEIAMMGKESIRFVYALSGIRNCESC